MNQKFELKYRVSVPAYERIKQLWAFGHSYGTIAMIVDSEFVDVEFRNMSEALVQKLVKENRKEFLEARHELGLKCKEEIQRQVAILFNKAEQVECDMVEAFSEKLGQCISSMRKVDLEEQDELGNYVNTSRVFTLIELSQKLQSTIAKITGTDALREIEVYRQKMEAKNASESIKLLPNGADRGVTVFV